ncbi:MAG: hypothetical protein HY898_08405 [Deltaproteobacteria bacterium]|nr:hypothetical protein [Deltaproteobacteria bacterium]
MPLGLSADVPFDLSPVAWYVVGMTRKLAISLPDQTLDRAKAAVRRGKARNVSNYIALLIDQESASESFEEMIADWLRESGASDQEIRAAERKALSDFERAGLAPKRKRQVRGNKQRDEAHRKAG